MIRPEPAKIVVPRKHGQLLVEPALGLLQTQGWPAGQGRDFQKHFGASLDELRSLGRAHLQQSILQWSSRIGAPPPQLGDKPLIFTGHQSEFYHAGVWAKVIAADELARRIGGVAIDVIVDHDVVEKLGFDVPFQAEEGGDWQRKAIEFAPPSMLPADSLDAPTGEQFDHWEGELGKYPLAHSDALAFFLTQLCHLDDRPSYVAWLSRARKQFEASQNVHVHHVPTSLLCTGELWRKFVTAWINNADAWTELYNTHLAAYRKRQGIKNDDHPMPNLARKDSGGGVITYELPFWIYRQGHPRQRMMIRKPAGSAATARILCSKTDHDPAEIFADPTVLLRPRALTLTMYLRLFFADVFIHGIGGALYDKITDALMQDLFAIVPPYGCVSAAWLLPLAQHLESSADVPALNSKRHHLAHNPQLALDASDPYIADLLQSRHRLIAEIRDSLAAQRRDPVARNTRHEKFQQLHTFNKRLHALNPRPLQSIDQQIAAAERARQQNKVLFHREYFFALHTIESLQKLIAKIRAS